MNEETTVKMFAIWLLDSQEPIALFEFQEQAEDWARENYFGQWLMKEVTIPYTPMFTQEEWNAAMVEAEVLIKKFKSLPEADD